MTVVQAMDVCVPHVLDSSEEAKKVQRNSGSKYLAVFKRITRPESTGN
jgi:hypothetical protein